MHAQGSLNKLALSATLHCLAGCSIGEVAGMMIGSAGKLDNLLTIVISTALAFTTGYLLSLWPVVKSGVALKKALLLVLAADTLSITVMELTDNLVMFFIPGALNAGLGEWLFWASLTLSLAAAFVAAWPVNKLLLAKGKGHALVHH